MTHLEQHVEAFLRALHEDASAAHTAYDELSRALDMAYTHMGDERWAVLGPEATLLYNAFGLGLQAGRLEP